MMIVVVNVMLAGSRSRGSCNIASVRGESARDTKASARRQRPSTAGTSIARFLRLTGRRQVLRGRAARHAMHRLDGRGYSLGIRLWPAKGSREPLKKIFNVLAFGLLFALVVLLLLPLFVLRAGRIWIVLGHGNLIVGR
jgi:hypothetical protein